MTTRVEQQLRLTLWAVGIQPGCLIMQERGQRVQFRRVQLDDVTINMCSPLWAHDVSLARDSSGWLVTHWHAAHYRACEDGRAVTDSAHLARIRKMVRQSFYTLLSRHPGDLRQLWAWEQGRDALSTQFSTELDLETWFEAGQGAQTPEQFWGVFKTQFATELAQSLKTLPFPSVGDGQVDPNRLDWLYRALECWRRAQPHYALYFRHRLLVMPQLVQCAQLPCNEPLQLGLLSNSTVKDLFTLQTQLYALRHRPLDAKGVYEQLSQLLRQTLGPQRLQQLLQHHLAEVWDEMRYNLVMALLVRSALEETELAVVHKRDTCWPLTFKSAASYSWGRLLGCEPSETDLRAMLPFVATPSETVPPLPLSMAHFGDFVLRLQQTRRPNWECVPGAAYRLQSPLVILCAKPAVWKQECTLRDECRQWNKQMTVLLPPFASQWDVAQWRTDYKALDSIDRALYQCRVTQLWFSPSESKLGCDMAQLELLLQSEFYTSSLVFPQRLLHTKGRVAQHFRLHPQLTPQRLRQHTHELGDEKGARDTVIGLDAHLWSYHELQRLIQWARSNNTVSRLVLIGCDDVTPLDCDGHAALDLTQWHELGVQRRVFDQIVLQEQSDALLTQCAPQVTLVPRWNDLQRVVLDAMDAGTSDCTELHLLAHSQRNRVHPLQDDVDAQLNIKFRLSHNVTVDCVSLEQLWQYERARGRPTLHLWLCDTMALKTLSRNELNTLFLGLVNDQLLVPTHGKALDARLEWLRKRLGKAGRVPNLRYTLPYYQRVMRIDTDNDTGNQAVGDK